MQNKEKMNPVLVFIADDETFKLEIVKREKIAYKDYLKGEEAVKFVTIGDIAGESTSATTKCMPSSSLPHSPANLAT